MEAVGQHPISSSGAAFAGPLALGAIPVPRYWAGTLAREFPAPPDIPDQAGEILIVGAETPVAGSDPTSLTLGDLFRRDPGRLVGSGWRADRDFPLCVRVLDVGRDRPLAVHPLAGPARGGDFLFWFCLAAGPEARVAAGLKARVTRRQFLERLNSGDLEPLLQVFPARPGDAFLIPPGRVHGVRAPILLLAIQPRCADPEVIEAGPQQETPLSPKLLSSIRFVDRHLSRISGDASETRYTRRIPLTPHCPAFLVEEIRLAPDLRDRTTGRTFHLLIAVRGTVVVRGENGTCRLDPVQAAWLPARAQAYSITAESGDAVVLRVVLP